MPGAINWFEIPVADVDRALRFYKLSEGEGYVPSTEGALVYLNGGDDLSAVVDRVEGAGGSVIMPKSNIGENGFIALFMDTEGNKFGLQSDS